MKECLHWWKFWIVLFLILLKGSDQNMMIILVLSYHAFGQKMQNGKGFMRGISISFNLTKNIEKEFWNQLHITSTSKRMTTKLFDLIMFYINHHGSKNTKILNVHLKKRYSKQITRSKISRVRTSNIKLSYKNRKVKN